MHLPARPAYDALGPTAGGSWGCGLTTAMELAVGSLTTRYDETTLALFDMMRLWFLFNDICVNRLDFPVPVNFFFPKQDYIDLEIGKKI